ncbi:MAG: KH domain-containing protein [Desulfobacteraceae bacterium]|nr:KH domain-containing protein [Desulfobacteraceae bacterium]MBU4054171.1 KH domain-containing protein [Pseudomonadota bacterium]
MKHLIEIIARALVDSPDDVSIKEVQGNSVLILELSVAKMDVGKIIGKQGRNVDAIRTLLNAVSAKNNTRTLLEIVE